MEKCNVQSRDWIQVKKEREKKRKKAKGILEKAKGISSNHIQRYTPQVMLQSTLWTVTLVFSSVIISIGNWMKMVRRYARKQIWQDSIQVRVCCLDSFTQLSYSSFKNLHWVNSIWNASMGSNDPGEEGENISKSISPILRQTSQQK